jgi:nitrate reductase NapE component
MIKNGVKCFFLGLFFVMYSSDFAFVHQKNEVVEKVHKNQLQQSVADESAKSNVDKKVSHKNSSKSRQRMSAGKIAGIVLLVLLGVAVIGALSVLIWVFGMGPHMFEIAGHLVVVI